MSRRSDRKKHGNKENSASANSKDESDAVTLRSSDIMPLRSSGQSVRSDDVHTSSLYPTPLPLLSESGSREGQQVDCKVNIIEMLKSLEGKIGVVLQKSVHSDSTDRESLELQSEMQKLLQATVKQKEDFNRLYETVRNQKEMLQRLEAKAKTGSLGLQVSAVIDSNEVLPIQCCHDLETRAHLDDITIVYLISGRHEFRRKLSQSSNELLNIYIPDSMNAGNRMLPGRQSFPNLLLQSLTFDTSANSPTVITPQKLSTKSLALELGAVGGAKETLGLGRSCPVCALAFHMSETLDAFELHVNSHFSRE